jgi:hypothetical protein
MLHILRGVFWLVFACLICSFSTVSDGWLLFARVPFKSTYFKEINEYFLVPTFTKELRAQEGKEMELRGHFIPMDMDGNSIVLSKFPYAACFFCGGAGPESVAEVQFKNKKPKLKPDQVISVRGKLQLNGTDINHLNFILKDAELIQP